MITFQADEEKGYRSRTIKNASADVTLAFAVDFTTAGEKLTKQAVLDQGKLYIPIDISVLSSEATMMKSIINSHQLIKSLELDEITLNIAGNGIYRLKDTFLMNQKMVDELTYRFIYSLNKELNPIKIKMVRTGGQSGFDEAGAKAGFKIGASTLVYAPNDWGFRDVDGNDHYNEQLFKSRFYIHR